MSGYHVWVFGERTWFETEHDAVSFARRAAQSCNKEFIEVKELPARRTINW